MRIAYLVNEYPYASSTFIRREIAAMEAAGLEVARFSIRRPATQLVDPADLKDRQNTRYILAGGAAALMACLLLVAMSRPRRLAQTAWLAIRAWWRSGRCLGKHLAYVGEACTVFRWCEGLGIGHLHAHYGTNSAMVAMLCHALGGPPYSFTAHGVETFDSPATLALDRKIADAAFVVGVSDFGRSQLCRWCAPEHWAKIHVIACGVDQSFFETPAQALPDSRCFAVVGRFSAEKGHLVLLEAAAELARGGVDFQIILVGEGPMRALIDQAVARLGLSHRVLFAGWKASSEVRDVILSCRAMILPSFAEGLPVVLMESLALGRPVISTYVAGIPELVEPGVNGWLVPAGSVAALAAAMRDALGAPAETLEAMGRAGRAKVMERHDAAKEAAKLAELFQQSCAARRAVPAAPASAAAHA